MPHTIARIAGLFILTGGSMFLAGCFGHSLQDYRGSEPEMDPREFFSGPIKAWGIVQNWRGKVVRRFEVDMHGSWEGSTGKLEEDFSYYDGETQHRTWTIQRLGPDSYRGSAGDIIGEASGATEGAAMRWSYVMELPVGDSTYNIRFDDWMFPMRDGVLMNRSYLKKFGITVAELTIFMQKQEP